MAKVFIIIGIYNCEKYLKESIESIIEQTFIDWELIMCEDGSSDTTYKIAKEFLKIFPEKINVLKNEKNYGLNYTLNKCLKEAKGEYIARQDGDDISIKNRLEIEEKFLDNNPNYALVSSNMIYFDENGEYGTSHMKRNPNKYDFIQGSPFCHAACMIRRDVIEEVKGYSVNKKLLRVEDYHLWFKIYEKGYEGYNIQECLYKMKNDIDAIKRRSWSNRINEAKVKKLEIKMLNINPIYNIYVLVPLIKGRVSNKIYIKIHKAKIKSKGQRVNEKK